MTDISDPDHVREQYADEARLETRRSVWQPTDDGRDPSNEAFKAIDRAMTGDAAVLEIGCGTGVMAERINALPGVTLVAIDFSERFVELTAARGIDARQGDICYLPFEDDSFDVVYAGWMLYHVRDLDRGLNEVRRVLRPGGTFAGSDSRLSLRFRLLHVGDTMVVVDPATMPERLRQAGFADAATDTGERSFRFRADR